MSDNAFPLGPYTVRICIRTDNPAFPVYAVFRGAKFIGKQFSRPCETDCQWLERSEGEYATESTWHESSKSTSCSADHRRRRGGYSTAKRGRPRKEAAAQELEEAIAS